MQNRVFPNWCPLLAALLLIVSSAALASAQQLIDTAPRQRIATEIDDHDRAPLPATVHPLTRTAQDLGPLDDSEPAERMLLLLKRSPEQAAALDEFIQSAHTPGHANFHHWLKPAEFGHRFGPTDEDINAVTTWLNAHGFTVNRVHAGRNAIEFSGTAGALRSAFRTELHNYAIRGRDFVANANNPTIPAALAPVVSALLPTNTIHPVSYLTSPGKAQYNPKTRAAQPLWTIPTGSSTPTLAVSPLDYYVQYDINSVFSNNINGYAQWIAIISASNIDVTVVKDYQSVFSIRSFLPEVVVDGVDPGINSNAIEAYLDTELANAAAPRAKVLLYVSSGTAVTSGLSLAAYRAVEDDVAGVISMSYGQCESSLGLSGNAFWYQLWQQAAAQGQTVFVAAGDSGSAGCDDFTSETEAWHGLAVNGIASTPYNVAVGATDFYYSNYNASNSDLTAQLANYWSFATSSFPTDSLLKTIPEQPWNSSLGYNILSTLSSSSTWNILATGGGASSAAISSNGTTTGYPKPSWQTATGVPSDGLRDLPDVSIFGGTGSNYSFHPICASLVDCTGYNSAGGVLVTAAGGTSAAAPLMAGIQTLVNQSNGTWAGQANYIYYPLAAAYPSAFHDVTIGQNTVLCIQGTANCVASSAPEGFYVESGYQATIGYDQASGLGSFDVANLIKGWSSVSYRPTSTVLGLTNSNFVHGKTITVAAAVAPNSGSGTPNGTIALTSIDGISRVGSFGSFPLVNGWGSAQFDNLPGGTYYIAANYSGDSTYAPSTSSYKAVTVTPENDNILSAGYVINPYDLNYYPLQTGITLPYGAQIFLDAEPIGVNETIANQLAAATGTINYSDTLNGATTVISQPLEVSGIAEWANGNFAPGSHSITLAYGGDASYNASSASNAFTFTILKGNTILKLIPLATSVAPSGSVAVDVQLYMGYQPLMGYLPSGTVTVTLGATTLTASLNSYGLVGAQYLEGIVTFTNLPAGILPLTATYAGDSNWLGTSANGGTIVALSTLTAPTLTITPANASITPGQTQVFTVVVSGPTGKPIPTGTVTIESDDGSYQIQQKLTIGATYSAVWITIPANSLQNGNNTLVAVYSGDSNYTAGASTPAILNVNEADFEMTLLNTSLNISAGGHASTTLVITPVNGFTGPVSVTASASLGLDIEPAVITPNVTGVYNDMLTIYTTSTLSPWTYPVLISGIGGGHMHTVMIYVLLH